ncbi:sodium:proton antiporter [Mesorhizobium sp. SP-1A]|uniref:cation:proton antiporter n=1 Tax=Mesorhizobium sp. SP-1A TaxID=3077840 RepID=UPI0028F701FC|nr:sodium:proton antiporter [Mesorhizobium sp. SP-1A]
MTIIEIAAMLVVLSAVLGWINHVFLGLPHAIGLLIMGLFGSLCLLTASFFIPGFTLTDDLNHLISSIDFFDTVMNGMLAFLLFAAALHVDVKSLKSQRMPILLMASFGVLVSTVVVGVGLWALSNIAGFAIPIWWALVFGALISPTDPVAVLSVLKTVKVPESLEAKIAGESLFNDGVGVVAFTVLLTVALATSGIMPTANHQLVDTSGAMNYLEVIKVFSVEVFGAIALGLAIGVAALWLIKKVDDAALETLITLAVVLGTYGLAVKLHFSGPIAVVIPGLIMGNWGANNAMSEETKSHLFPFWTMVDEVLNSVLFLLIGLEVLVLRFDQSHIVVSLLCIPLVLAARYISVATPVTFLRAAGQKFSNGAVRIMTWGGVRGGISVALALSLPENEYKSTILTVTYVVVVFSIIVQGLTIAPLVKRLAK